MRRDFQREVGPVFAGAASSGAASQILTVPSPLAEASRLPSMLNATLVTPRVCPLSASVSCHVAVSHTFAVVSKLPEASRLPSELNAGLVTTLECPLRVVQRHCPIRSLMLGQ